MKIHIVWRFFFPFSRASKIGSRGQGWFVQNSYTLLLNAFGQEVFLFFVFFFAHRETVRLLAAKREVNLFIFFSSRVPFTDKCFWEVHFLPSHTANCWAPKRNALYSLFHCFYLFSNQWIVAIVPISQRVFSSCASKCISLHARPKKILK